jgi:hypothetical protein
MAKAEIAVAWSRRRRVHLVAPQGLVEPVDEAALRKALPRLNDLDGVAEAVARIVGRRFGYGRGNRPGPTSISTSRRRWARALFAQT